MSTQQPLKGSITNDPDFLKLSFDDQKKALGAVDSDFGALNPGDQTKALASIRVNQIQKHLEQNQHDLQAASDNSPLQLLRDAGAASLGVGANALNSVGLGLPNLGAKALTGKSLTDLSKQGGKALGASPGVYNDPFGIQSLGGNIAGAVAGLPKVAAVLGKAALPAFSVAPVASEYFQGNLTPQQALTQGGINLATSFVPGGQGVIQNALKQGAGQAAGGFASSALNGGDLGQNLVNAAREGTLGAFLGGVRSGITNTINSTQEKTPTYQGKAVQQYGPTKNRVTVGRPEQILENKVNNRVNDYDSLLKAGKVNQADYQLKRLPPALQALVKDHPVYKGIAQGNQQQLTQDRIKLAQELAKVKAEQQVKPIRARTRLEKERQNTIALRQAGKGQRKVNPAQPQPQQPTESNPLKGQIRITGPGRNFRTIEQAIQQGRSIELEHHANKAGSRDSSTFEQKHDFPFEIKHATRLVDTKTKRIIMNPGTDDHVRPGSKQGKELVAQGKAEVAQVPMAHVVNENGQMTYRHLEDIKGAVKISDKQHGYHVELDDAGNYQPINSKTGEKAEQTRENLTKHRDLQGIAERLKSGESVKNQELIDAGHSLNQEEFENAMKDVPEDQIDRIAKELGC